MQSPADSALLKQFCANIANDAGHKQHNNNSIVFFAFFLFFLKINCWVIYIVVEKGKHNAVCICYLKKKNLPQAKHSNPHFFFQVSSKTK